MIKTILIFLFSLQVLFGATIEGFVVGSDSLQPLVGANVIENLPNIGAASDFEGYFKINNLPVGKHILKVS